MSQLSSECMDLLTLPDVEVIRVRPQFPDPTLGFALDVQAAIVARSLDFDTTGRSSCPRAAGR